MGFVLHYILQFIFLKTTIFILKENLRIIYSFDPKKVKKGIRKRRIPMVLLLSDLLIP